MTGRWAVSLPRPEAGALKRLRRLPRVEVCEVGLVVWLRGEQAGEQAGESLERRLRAIPGARRFTLLADGQLQPIGARVPSGNLPAGPWMPVADWLKVELTRAVWPGRASGRAALQLVRSADVVEPTLLLTRLDEWAAYGGRAPQVRLDRWTFAADDRGRVIVRGVPLPPLRGERFVEQDGVAVPAGWHWSPAVDAATVRELLQTDQGELQAGDLALLFFDGSWEAIAGDCFVRATRSAVRLTAEAANGSAAGGPRDGR